MSDSLYAFVCSCILPPPPCLCLRHCRNDRRICDKNGEITTLQERIAELEVMVEQKRKDVKNLQEGLQLRQESPDIQQQQRQQVGSEGICGWMGVRGCVDGSVVMGCVGAWRMGQCNERLCAAEWKALRVEVFCADSQKQCGQRWLKKCMCAPAEVQLLFIIVSCEPVRWSRGSALCGALCLLAGHAV